MLEKVQEIVEEVRAFHCSNTQDIEAFRISMLGKKGKITALFNEFKNVPNDQKKEFGKQLNILKKETQEKVNQLKASTKTNDKGEIKSIDLTIPSQPYNLGSRHPISIVKNEIIEIKLKETC